MKKQAQRILKRTGMLAGAFIALAMPSVMGATVDTVVQNVSIDNLNILVLFAGMILINYVLVYNKIRPLFWALSGLTTLSLYMYFPTSIIYIGFGALLQLALAVITMFSFGSDAVNRKGGLFK